MGTSRATGWVWCAAALTIALAGCGGTVASPLSPVGSSPASAAAVASAASSSGVAAKPSTAAASSAAGAAKPAGSGASKPAGSAGGSTPAAAANASAGGAPASAPPGSAQNGQELFSKDGCYECHDYQGQGGTGTGPKLAPNPLPFVAFQAQVRTPRQDMPKYPPQFLSDQDLADIYAYLQSVPAGPNASSLPLLTNR
ncbi:MAG TPA: cytochrome c [Chloroflexota bacterium]|nr:cytochrome c [Chloroflexota bacterium]